jgi:WD40 repeat protein
MFVQHHSNTLIDATWSFEYAETFCVDNSGSRSGYIHHHDVRVAEHLVGSFAGHSQEVCGLKWSPDGKYLASGGNDNMLNIWPTDPGVFYSAASPIHTFSQHQAAVKVNMCKLQIYPLIKIGIACCAFCIVLTVITLSSVDYENLDCRSTFLEFVPLLKCFSKCGI